MFVLASYGTTYAEKKKLTDEAELSFVDTGGNTDVTTLSAKNLLKYQFADKLQGAWKLAALYGESDGEINAERYSTEARLDYLLTMSLYSYATTGWMRDELAGISSRYYMGPGVGYSFLVGPKHYLKGEAGLNYVRKQYIDNTNKSYLEGRAFTKYEYAFTERNKLSQSMEILYDFGDNYNVNSETALVSALNDYLALKTSYLDQYDNKPIPETLRKTDTILGLTLVVNF